MKDMGAEPHQFELRNSAWSSTLREVVGKVAQKPGFVDGASSIRAELHKLLFYGPCAFFDKHREYAAIIFLFYFCEYTE